MLEIIHRTLVGNRNLSIQCIQYTECNLFVINFFNCANSLFTPSWISFKAVCFHCYVARPWMHYYGVKKWSIYFVLKLCHNFQVTSIHTIFGCIKDNIKQRAKQIIKAENDGDEMRQAEQVHDMDAYTRPTLQILVITFWWLTRYLTIRTKIKKLKIRWNKKLKIRWNCS